MPLIGACCELSRCEPVEARVRAGGVVVDPPFFDDVSCLVEIGEQVLVEALVTQTAVEALYEAILHGFAGGNVVPFDTVVLLPAQDRVRGQLSAVVAHDHARICIRDSKGSTSPSRQVGGP